MFSLRGFNGKDKFFLQALSLAANFFYPTGESSIGGERL
jgi:hypothetical protein